MTDRSRPDRIRRRNDPVSIPIDQAFALLGQRWILQIVHRLLRGPSRFTDLRRNIPGVSANILTRKLEEMIADGLVQRALLPPPANVQVYELTGRGKALSKTVESIGNWASLEVQQPCKVEAINPMLND